MVQLKTWTAYYTHGRIYHSADHTWASLPGDGLLIIAVDESERRQIIDGGDWYWREAGEFGYVPSESWDYTMPPPSVECQSCVKRGARADDAEFYALYSRVRNREL